MQTLKADIRYMLIYWNGIL